MLGVRTENSVAPIRWLVKTSPKRPWRIGQSDRNNHNKLTALVLTVTPESASAIAD